MWVRQDIRSDEGGVADAMFEAVEVDDGDVTGVATAETGGAPEATASFSEAGGGYFAVWPVMVTVVTKELGE